MNVIYAKNPKFSSADNSTIDLIVKFDAFNEEIPFTANPNDVVLYGRELYAKAMNGDFGNIAQYVPPSSDFVASVARNNRDALLAASDWTQLPDVPQEIKTLWADYRQKLRDVPQQEGFPENIIWPEKPQ